MLILLLITFITSYLAKHKFWRTQTSDNKSKDKKRFKDIEDLITDKKINQFPIGWYKLPDMNTNTLLNYQMFGDDVIIVKDENNNVKIYDPYCPHLGARFDDGKITSEGIECPFHSLKFNPSNGKCKSERMSLESRDYIIKEFQGIHFVWYHPDDGHPEWDIDTVNLDGLNRISKIQHVVKSYIRDISENAADKLHFGSVHDKFFGLPDWILSVNWDLDYKGGRDDDKHLADIHLDLTIGLLGVKLDFFKYDIDIVQIGPGIVYFDFKNKLMNFKMIQSVFPTQKYRNVVHHEIWAKKSVFNIIYSKILLFMLSDQFDSDIKIWNNKKAMNRPHYIKGDSDIKKYRRWYSQF